MCVIVGFIGDDLCAVDVLIDGLRRLEYRGYDSAGVALIGASGLEIRRAEGKLAALESSLRSDPIEGRVGIGHTRWATHGKPSERNAHPHRAGHVVVVHNGIIENYRELRAECEAAGRTITSETDTELIAHLIDTALEEGKGLLEATRLACSRLAGSFAMAALSETDPSHIVAAKNGGSPMILGFENGQSFLASDIPAILPYTREMLFLDDGNFAVLSEDGIQVVDAEGRPLESEFKTVQWDPVSAEKGGYDRFMQKEIFEQPRAITDTIGTRVDLSKADVDLDGIVFRREQVEKMSRVTLVACGTAYYACMVGRYMIEQLAGIPCDVDLASEFRYRQPIVDGDTLVVAVSQSGETADTLAALREGRQQGARILSISNTRDSSVARESDDVLYTQAGPEIGVASTKCFTSQIVALYLLAMKLAIVRGRLSEKETRQNLENLIRLPRYAERVLQMDQSIKAMATHYVQSQDFLFLGRGIMYPIALEGALKLKEISYIHAEGYAAGEMKHGPIALIDENMPVLVIATAGPLQEKLLSNLEQVRARGGQVIAMATEGDEQIAEKANQVIYIPELGPYLTAVLAALPLQLLAYHIATQKGTDVDQPRNLAKSVTVE